MSRSNAGRFFTLLCVLGMLMSATHGAEPAVKESTSPDASNVRKYSFELQTFNQSEQVRRGQGGISGGSVHIDIASAMTDDELESVTKILDELGASPPDDDGCRSFSMPNETRVRIGGFEDPTSGVPRLPMEFTLKGEFSTSEASLVLRLAAAGNLFIASAADPERVTTTARVEDRGFQRRHKNASVTADEQALVDWVRQNVAPLSSEER